jgi:hypothetical protein
MPKIILLFLLLGSISFSQIQKTEGFVYDTGTGIPLSYANIRISGTTSGTSTNIDGEFNLELKPGSYSLIFSYVGYKSDTSLIEVPLNKKIEISLVPREIILNQVVVTANEDPAYNIIREAIKRKKENKRGLKNFDYNVYSKRIVRSAGEVAAIVETFVKGYNKVDNWEKEYILSTHKTEN